jgi:shikimate dehydrogenase
VTSSGSGGPTGDTRLAAVIGAPVRHSLSPLVHNAAFRALDLDWTYLAFEVQPADLPDALDGVRALGIAGLSVTMPHKEDVAGLVDELSDDARLLGAVNCVVNDRGRLVGHNTDGPGFVAALAAELGVRPEGKRCLVVGAGGAARAVVLALGRAGAATVVVANRTPGRAEHAAALAGAAGRVADRGDVAAEVALADVVVNATSVGMGMPGSADVPFPTEALHPGQVVADIVYQPLVTPLVASARHLGVTATNGVSMLVHQAAVAFELWTGVSAPVQVMTAAVERSLATGDAGGAGGPG